jgi:exodeoxyribonuclease VII small subunit
MAKKKPTKKNSASKTTVAFEESLASLKEILADLEEGNLPLSESLEKYESGIKHLRNCNEALQKAKSRIELLVRVDQNGKAITKPFEHSATVEESNISEEDADSLQDELDEATDEDGDWDGGLF